MVCFRYIIVNTVHTGDDKDNNNNNNNNNNNRHYKTNIMQQVYYKQEQAVNADDVNIWQGDRAHYINVPKY